MNTVELHTYELRVLQTLVGNRLGDLDRHIATHDYNRTYRRAEYAAQVKQDDERYRADLQCLLTKLDSANPI